MFQDPGISCVSVSSLLSVSSACLWVFVVCSNLFVKLLELGANPNVLCDYPPVSPMMFGNLPSEDYFQRSSMFLSNPP